MTRFLLLAFAGAAGTLARYLLSGAVHRWLGAGFPYGTFAVNLVGCFLVGLTATLATERIGMNPIWRTAILVGFFGAFTTFSALTYETLELARSGEIWRAALNLGGQTVLGLGAVWAGFVVAASL